MKPKKDNKKNKTIFVFKIGLQPISTFLRTLMISQGALCGVTMEEIDAKFMGNQDIASQFLRNCTKQWLAKK